MPHFKKKKTGDELYIDTQKTRRKQFFLRYFTKKKRLISKILKGLFSDETKGVRTPSEMKKMAEQGMTVLECKLKLRKMINKLFAPM